MNAAVKNQLSQWALNTLQMTHDQINTSSFVKCICDTFVKPTSDVENQTPLISRADVSNHCSYESCWIVINNKVYDVTRFLRLHPGGVDIILEHGGCDASSVFVDKGHSTHAFDMLNDYCIGQVTPADWMPEKEIT